MTWYDLKNLANENQGVISILAILITIIISLISWLIKKITRNKKDIKTDTQPQQQVNPVIYTPEGHNFGQIIIRQNNYYNSEQSRQDKINTIKEQMNLSILQVAHFRFYLIKIKDSRFIIRNDDLLLYIRDFEKNEDNCLKMNRDDLIELLKRFNAYDDEGENQNIKLNYSLYDFIVDQLTETNFSIQIDIKDDVISTIPLNNLSASDFDISNKRFSININRKL